MSQLSSMGMMSPMAGIGGAANVPPSMPPSPGLSPPAVAPEDAASPQGGQTALLALLMQLISGQQAGPPGGAMQPGDGGDAIRKLLALSGKQPENQGAPLARPLSSGTNGY